MDVSVSSGNEEISINISCLKNNLDATLKIAEEIMFMPKFSSEDFELVKKENLDAIAQMQTSAATIAGLIYNQLIYGNDHMMSVPAIGTSETVSSISLDDVKKCYEGFSSEGASIAISGDVKKEEVLAKMSFVTKLKANPVVKPSEPAIPSITKTKIYFVDKKNAPQSEI